ncbi:PAS domain S-box-containing protein [Mucilaginibacter mallensis]|uniref:histidine kinase n=1 Tax=Mucilaginibacter mallensis TaxID=652787 RepID=A0A1H1QZZ4_MUCMA|nr:PAS domain-containing sensor histidine kinase [Mucilaginibacter mallensis]SDS29091.1 PAS domain S-box-containing protein [Mucilaginibacter mallensis]
METSGPFSAYGQDDLELISDQHLCIALDNSRIGFWELDLLTYEMRCTGTCKKNVGLTAHAYLDYPTLLSLIHPDDLPQVNDSMKNAIENEGQRYQSEYRIIYASSPIRWVKADGIALFENGKAVKMLGTTIDITERKLIELQKDELISIVNHEVNTPLTSIRSYLQLLARLTAGNANEKISQIVERTSKSAERLRNIINDYLSTSQKNGARLNHHSQVFRLDELIWEIADNVQTISFTHKIQVGAMPCVWIEGDRQGISQVLTNLLTNAIKYSPNRNTVDVNLTVYGVMLKVAVRDYGIGIAEKDIKKLFKKSFKADNGADIEGTGMGLYICDEIIHRHNGQIGVDSREGLGSIFHFTLPFVKLQHS